MKISNETKVGILAILAILLLVLGYSYLKGERVFAQDRTFYAEYANISGLSTSDDVLYRGLAIGKIQSIELIPGNEKAIRVSFNIGENIDIPTNSEARIVNSDLLGDKALELILGDATTMAEEGATLLGTVEQSLQTQIEEQLLPVKTRIEGLIASIDSVITRVNGIFDVDFQGKVDEYQVSIEAAIKNIRNITESVDAIVANEATKIDTVMTNVKVISQAIADNEQALRNTFTNLETITDSIAKINLVNTFTQLDSVTADLAVITSKVKSGDGNLAMLINEKELYENLEAISKNLELLLEDIRKKPGRYAPSLLRVGNR